MSNKQKAHEISINTSHKWTTDNLSNRFNPRQGPVQPDQEPALKYIVTRILLYLYNTNKSPS